MTITMTWTDVIVVFVTLLAMFSPPATLGTAAAFLRYAPQEVHRRLAWEIARNYAIVLLLAIWLGRQYPGLADQAVLSAIVFAMVPVVAVTFLVAGPVTGRLSAGAQDALARFSGIVLVALAIQMLVRGFAELLAGTPFGAAILAAGAA